jgi:tRNA threonylcarbamoyladenosine biosynthesis protein TsaB
LQRCGRYQVLPPAALCDLIKTTTLLLGSGAELYRDFFRQQLGELAVFAPAQLYFARAAAIGLLAQARWHQGNLLDPAQATPIYVRSSDARPLSDSPPK